MVKSSKNGLAKTVYIVDGNRTPFIKAAGKPNPMSASDLAVAACQPLLARQNFTPDAFDEVVVGCMAPSVDEANIGRIIAQRIGCPDNVMGWTVQRNCASGLQAIDSACQDIRNNRHQLVLAGGTEAMSRIPLLLNDDMVHWMAALNQEKKWYKKLLKVADFRPKFLKPIIAILRGLTDATIGMNMGQTAEKLAFQFGIDRKVMDEFAVQSHLKAVTAIENGYMGEVSPLFDWKGRSYLDDNGIRPDSSTEKLAKLKAVFDRPFGKVTAGNSSQVTDGAAFLILASEEAVEKYHLTVRAKIIETQWAGLDPTVMGLGPAYAIGLLLKALDMKAKDVDYWEVNEAFAAQVIACLKAMNDESFCKEALGLNEVIGEIPAECLNVDGGAIALGHPVGASGARVVLHLLNVLERQQAKRGVASLCIGGGQGGAMMIERV